jgi:hypothetical protein
LGEQQNQTKAKRSLTLPWQHFVVTDHFALPYVENGTLLAM